MKKFEEAGEERVELGPRSRKMSLLIAQYLIETFSIWHNSLCEKF
jgi:hypothetical protein